MLCCIFNYAPHYRSVIYKKMSEELHADFYFGENLKFKGETIKKIDINKLEGFKKEFHIKYFKFFIDLEWYCGLIPLVFNRKYDKYIIYPHKWAINQWIFLIIARLLGKKVYSWEHGLKTYTVRNFVLQMDLVLHKLLSGSFIYGNHAKNIMIDLKYDKSKLFTIYNSLDFDLTFKYRNKIIEDSIYKEKFNNDNPVLLFIGRVNSSKKLNLLFEAQEILIKKGIYTNVVIIGGGECINELNSIVKSKELLDRAWFFGPIYDEYQISQMIFNATICVSPGSIGLTAIHSFSYGLPVITHDDFFTQGPEFEIIEEGISGLFFAKDNLDSLVEKIEYWLLRKTNRNEVREQCYKQIDQYYNPYNQIRIFKSVINA